MSVARGKISAALAAALVMLLGVSGCSFDLSGVVSEKVKEHTGIDADITFGAGPSCLPDWVNYPDDDAANQGVKVPGGEMCVSSFFVPKTFDANQSLPEVLDDSDFEELAELLLPLFLSQIPGPVRDILRESDGLGEWTDKLSELDDVLIFKAYGEGERMILLLVADGGDVDDYQLVLGAFCQGSC